MRTELPTPFAERRNRPARRPPPSGYAAAVGLDPVKLAAVEFLPLANKIARIAWALMTRKEVYHANGRDMADAMA